METTMINMVFCGGKCLYDCLWGTRFWHHNMQAYPGLYLNWSWETFIK